MSLRAVGFWGVTELWEWIWHCRLPCLGDNCDTEAADWQEQKKTHRGPWDSCNLEVPWDTGVIMTIWAPGSSSVHDTGDLWSLGMIKTWDFLVKKNFTTLWVHKYDDKHDTVGAHGFFRRKLMRKEMNILISGELPIIKSRKYIIPHRKCVNLFRNSRW